ncbi:MAG: hypothetical protein KDI21_00325 [Halieaceae bacterium]|nr:hypothetical protein [Halieaceae bacterium]
MYKEITTAMKPAHTDNGVEAERDMAEYLVHAFVPATVDVSGSEAEIGGHCLTLHTRASHA